MASFGYDMTKDFEMNVSRLSFEKQKASPYVVFQLLLVETSWCLLEQNFTVLIDLVIDSDGQCGTADMHSFLLSFLQVHLELHYYSDDL